MKYLVSLIFLLGTVSTAQAQDEIIPRDTGLVKLSQAEVTKLFENVNGKWEVKARAWSSKVNGYKELSGSAIFEKRLKDNYIHEDFSIDWFGTLLHGEGFVRYSPLHQRFDFVQLDDFSSSPLKLIGTWDGAKKKLSFRPIFNHAQWDSKKPEWFYWDYYFYDDGSFKKEIWEKNKQGEFKLTSDYHYYKIGK
jgi:hypothetical protein